MAYTSGVYATVTPAEQLALLQDLGATNYRADIYNPNDSQLLASIMTGVFANSGVSLLPCIVPVYFNQAGTESDAYNLGYQLAVSVITPLKGIVQHVECGNELDANGLINGPGNSPSDYNPAYWPAYRGVIRGMIDGVKAVDPTIKCGVNVGIPLAYTALQMLWNGVTPDGSSTGVTGATPVRWDVTMYHWYESSGDIRYAGAFANINVLEILTQSFGLPIWLTEWGFIPSDTMAGRASYVTGVLNEYHAVRAQYNLESIMMYEMISAASSDDFGLIGTDGATKTLAYSAFKTFTAANPV
ncbi:lipopolysaccharide biosynthesis protein [Paraburkholderia sp. DHOC27]|uniref:lipopolysaccharide biosynthesis protein n=1 Tax=Paraburkholderia sp. DHOC27 TaxID=2303330 RepID=UPI000E3ECCE4|nr:lipopolysaccharide biosynthesis protein [Paraburkholderia sp. DHOC27]RFU47219.1 lipopolysaccharide biosynthesis protein [Paraburkholderia sp. DHOC27]